MFDAILRFSVKKKLFVGLTTLFLLIGGIYSMLTLPIDAVPDITNNQVQIVTVSPNRKSFFLLYAHINASIVIQRLKINGNSCERT